MSNRIPTESSSLFDARGYALWDGCHDDPITPDECRAVAAQWRDTTQMSNALDAAAVVIERLRSTLQEVADHTVVSEGEFPDDNCDWHCTVTMAARAKDALNV